MNNLKKNTKQIQEIKTICSKAEDIYKISKVLHQYCMQHSFCEELNDISPITKQLYNLCDNLYCDLQNLVNGENPDQ